MIKITSSLFQKIHVCIVNNSTNIKIYPYEQQVEMSKSMLSEFGGGEVSDVILPL